MVTLPRQFIINVIASFFNPRTEGPFDIMEFAELGFCQGRNAIGLNQNFKLSAGINRERFCACFYEGRSSVLILAKEQRLFDRF